MGGVQKVFLVLFILLLFPVPTFCLEVVEQDVPDIYVSQRYRTGFKIHNNKTETVEIVGEGVEINDSRVSLVPDINNPTSLEPDETAWFYFKSEEKVNTSFGNRRIVCNISTEEAKKSIEVQSSVEDPLELISNEGNQTEKLSQYQDPFNFQLRVRNRGKGKSNFRFDLSFTPEIFYVRADSLFGELDAGELTSYHFEIEAGNSLPFDFKVLPTQPGKTGELKLKVFSKDYPNVGDSITYKIHTMTTVGNFMKFQSSPGISGLAYLVLPFLALVLLRNQFL